MRPMTRAAAVLAAAVFSASSARALDMSWLTQYKRPNIRYGQLALHPRYQFTEAYDSNIYLVPRDTPARTVGGGVRGSWITMNELALETVLPWRKLHTFSAGYDFAAHTYTTQPRLNDTINQSAHADYVYAGTYGLTGRLGDRYMNTTDQAFSQLVERQRRWANTLFMELGYEPVNGLLAGGLDASQTAHKYLSPTVGRDLNRYEQRAGFNVGYRLQPKTKLYASYHRGVIHYTVHRQIPYQDKDSKSHDLGFGVTGALAPKVAGQVEGGLTYRQYDEAPIGGTTRLTRNFTVAANAVYTPTDRTSLTLAASRRLEESIDTVSRFYISNNVSLEVRRRLARKFSVSANAAFGVDKYPDTQTVDGGATGNRRDDIYQGGVQVEYDIQSWLSTGLAYAFRERDSTFTGQYNYQDHQTSWNLALKF